MSPGYDKIDENSAAAEAESPNGEEGKQKKLPKGWADEIDALLRLFLREGRTKFGLLLLEIAWIGFLALIAELFKRAGSSSSPGRVGLGPFFGWPRRPFNLAITDLWLPGSVIILGYWLVASERIRNIYAVPRLAGRWLTLGLSALVTFLCAILDTIWSLPLYLILLGLQWLRPKLAAQMAAAKEQKPKESHSGLKRFIFTPRTIEEFVYSITGFSDIVGGWMVRLAQPLVSRARIGLARITDTNSEEARLSAKFSLQVWANAEQRVATLLQDTDAADWVSLVVLPGETRVRSRQHAASLARLFSLDMVVWGSYTDPRPDGSRSVRMNFYRPVSRRKPDEKKQKDSDLAFSLFKRRQSFDVAAMEVAEEELKELYWILAVSVLGVLADRSEADRKRGIWNIWNRIDKLRYSGANAINSVLPEMAERFIAGSGGPAVASSSSALTPIFSAWAVSGFDMFDDRELSLWEISIARETLEKCVADFPNQSIHLYRLGALYAYLKEYELAMSVFTRAKNARYNLIGPRSAFWAEDAVRDIKRSHGDKMARAWARFAATAAEILHHGKAHAVADLLKIRDDKVFWDIYAGDNPVSEKLVRDLLERK